VVENFTTIYFHIRLVSATLENPKYCPRRAKIFSLSSAKYPGGKKVESNELVHKLVWKESIPIENLNPSAYFGPVRSTC